MTRTGILNNNRTIALLAFLAVLFSIIYLVFVPHTFAQNSKDAKLARLEAQKLKVCQVHERNIKNRLDSLTRLVTNQENKFASIAARVQNRYTTKLVPQGKTLSNYNALLAEIATKKTAVDSALTTAKTDAANFSCTADDPKALLTQFRKDMQAVKRALHDYRKSVRNLIVAVAGLAGEKLSSSPTPTPTPTP